MKRTKTNKSKSSQVREYIKMLGRIGEKETSKQIAVAVGCSHQLVTSIRRQMRFTSDTKFSLPKAKGMVKKYRAKHPELLDVWRRNVGMEPLGFGEASVKEEGEPVQYDVTEQEDEAMNLIANDVQVGGDHYKKQTLQPWDAITAWGLDFLAGNVVKYVVRHKDKGGVEDLKKARHYLDKLIEVEGAK